MNPLFQGELYFLPTRLAEVFFLEPFQLVGQGAISENQAYPTAAMDEGGLKVQEGQAFAQVFAGIEIIPTRKINSVAIPEVK
jgi:hypothetical protein